jgi:hypothetical protein
MRLEGLTRRIRLRIVIAVSLVPLLGLAPTTSGCSDPTGVDCMWNHGFECESSEDCGDCLICDKRAGYSRERGYFPKCAYPCVGDCR